MDNLKYLKSISFSISQRGHCFIDLILWLSCCYCFLDQRIWDSWVWSQIHQIISEWNSQFLCHFSYFVLRCLGLCISSLFLGHINCFGCCFWSYDSWSRSGYWSWGRCGWLLFMLGQYFSHDRWNVCWASASSSSNWSLAGSLCKGVLWAIHLTEQLSLSGSTV